MPLHTRCPRDRIQELIDNEGVQANGHPVAPLGVLRLCLDLREAVDHSRVPGRAELEDEEDFWTRLNTLVAHGCELRVRPRDTLNPKFGYRATIQGAQGTLKAESDESAADALRRLMGCDAERSGAD